MMRPVEGRVASRIILSGLRGTLREQTAAVVAALTGWRVLPEAPDHGASARPDPAIVLAWPFVVSREGADGADGLRVLLCAPWVTRIRRIAAEDGLGETEAAGLAIAQQRELDEQARRAGWAGAEDAERFDLVINTDRLAPSAAAGLIVAAWRGRESTRLAAGEAPVRPAARASEGAPPPVHHPAPPDGRVSFAHPSEEEFARVLDFYRVRWQYEPTTFPLEWDEQGRVTSAFTPDFYLPDLDLYVELTTMKQGLVSRKNRKIRRLKELYPDLHIKVFYGRDYEKLLRKFGL